MQEICIDILLPEGFTIPGINFKRQVLQLNGQLYPQDLVQAKLDHFTLALGPLPNFVLPKLPPDLQKTNWQCISIIHEDDELAADPVKLKDAYLKGDVLPELLRKLTEQAGSWILIFTSQCDKPTEVLPGHWKAAVSMIKESLEYDKGFMMYYDGTEVPVK